MYIDKRLLKAAADGGNRIVLEVGDSFTGTFQQYDCKKDEKYQKMRHVFTFLTEDGLKKELRCNAKKFLQAMAYIEPNTRVTLTKTGAGMESNYLVETLSAPKQAQQVEIVPERDLVEEEEVITLEEEDEDDDTVPAF